MSGRAPMYLIELQQHAHPASWWTGLWFSPDVNTAARFPVREDAEVALQRLETADDIDRSRLAVTEHLWVTPRPPAPKTILEIAVGPIIPPPVVAALNAAFDALAWGATQDEAWTEARGAYFRKVAENSLD